MYYRGYINLTVPFFARETQRVN